MIPPPSTAIADALDALRKTKALSERDITALHLPIRGVRTLGDLVTVVERGEIADAVLAKKLKEVFNT